MKIQHQATETLLATEIGKINARQALLETNVPVNAVDETQQQNLNQNFSDPGNQAADPNIGVM